MTRAGGWGRMPRFDCAATRPSVGSVGPIGAVGSIGSVCWLAGWLAGWLIAWLLVLHVDEWVVEMLGELIDW